MVNAIATHSSEVPYIVILQPSQYDNTTAHYCLRGTTFKVPRSHVVKGVYYGICVGSIAGRR